MSVPAKYKVVKDGREIQTNLPLAEAVQLRKRIKTESPTALVTLMLDRPAPAPAGEEV